MIELLAPAGSRESLVAAVENGADAVYLAGKMFGARAFAGNFDEEGLREALRFAHLRGVHVHVTVNTIVADEELSPLADYLKFLYEIGVDAILVQDLGVARLARRVTPGLPLHASTQMTVHSLDGVLALQELGFSRVVLSRELSLKDIRNICANSDVEIETFLHGALCVCYSGQCLMSSMIGGRSGNRGRCAQPCRLPYELVDADGKDLLEGQAGKYLLSPRDLNSIELLPEFLSAGVSSLKIEGRMKRPEYVATVVRTYRKALDRCLSGETYAVTEEERRDLAQIFNRDFTTAYLLSRPGKKMMSDRRPNNRGLSVGRVLSYDREQGLVCVKLSEELSPGDQVDFWVKVGGRVTATIQKLMDRKGREILRGTAGDEVNFRIPAAVRAHDRVFKVYDAALMERAKNSYASGTPLRRIPVSVKVEAAVGSPLSLRMEDGEGNVAEARTRFIGQEAKKHPLSREIVEKQVNRLGTSAFSLKTLEAHLSGNVMVPLSEINEARRDAVDKLEELRLLAFRREGLPQVSMPLAETIPLEKEGNCDLVAAVDSLSKARAAIEAGADAVLFGGESYRHEVLSLQQYREAWEMARRAGRRIFYQTPRILRETDRKSLVRLLEAAEEFPPEEIYVHNIGTLSLVKKLTGFPIHGDYSLISFNRLTLEFLKEYGAVSATLSPELNWQQIEKLREHSPLPLECIVHGNLELMVSEYCAPGSFLGGAPTCSNPCGKSRYFLKDRKGIRFPLVMDQFCRMHVLNGKELSMLPYARKFKELGIQRIRIEGKLYEEDKLARLIRSYRRAMEYDEKQLAHREEELREAEGENITRGHYFRGV